MGALTTGNAAIQKNIAVAGNAGVDTLGLLGIQKILEAATVCDVFAANADLNVFKPMSGAGDDAAIAEARLALGVGLQGVVGTFASSNTVLHLTKNVYGYGLAMSVTAGKIRRLYIYNELAAAFEIASTDTDVVVEYIDVFAEVEEAKQTVQVSQLRAAVEIEFPIAAHAELDGGQVTEVLANGIHMLKVA